MATKVGPPPKPARKPPRERLPDTPDPIEIAMTAAASGKPLPNVARRVLEEQAELIHAQRLDLRLRHVGEIVRAALWAILAILALAIVALLGTVLYRAAHTDALVVERFRVPPSMVSQGLSGEVVATQVLDKIAEFQDQTESVRAATSYDNNWGDDLKIDIPQTGATLDQLWKLLRSWLGKETRISGEVIQTNNGLALTTRVGSAPGQRFVSDSGDLDALVTQGAEHIFKRTQPYRYAIYVGGQGRADERHAMLMELTQNPSPVERKWAYSGLSFGLNGLGRFRDSVEMAKRALAIDPAMGPALANGGAALNAIGHDQDALNWSVRLRDAHDRGYGREYDPLIAAANACGVDSDIAWLTRDPMLFDRSAVCADSAVKGRSADVSWARGSAAFLRHDAEAAGRFLRHTTEDLFPGVAAYRKALAPFVAEFLKGPSPRLAEALAAFRELATDTPYYRAAAPVISWPLQADALSLLGRHSEAAELIARTPLDCYECVRVRGIVAERRGAAREAQRWYAEAVRQGPRLPAAYADWGRLLARHGRFEAAEVRFRKAIELGPNWADPLKYWGDALASRGRRDEALARYDAALKLAPKWMDLRRDRAKLTRAS